MANNNVDIQFAGQYYEQIRDQLVKRMREVMPAGWDENENEPLYQIISAFAYGLHQTNALLDYVASNMFLATVQNRRSLRALLALIGVALREVEPAKARLVAKLTTDISAKTVVPVGGTFGTKGDPQVVFSTRDEFAFDGNEATSTWQDGTPPNILYFGHNRVMFTGVDFSVGTPATTPPKGVWEYYDANTVAGNPDAVSWDSQNLKFTLDTIFGTDDYSGATVTMVYLPTGYAVDIVTSYESGHNIAKTAITFGQNTPSTDPKDYQVKVQWRPLALTTNEVRDSVTGTDFGATGTKQLRFTLPEGINQQWGQYGNDALFAIRYRCQNNGDISGLVVTPTMAGDQYVAFDVYQGNSAIDTFTGTGEANQVFSLSGWQVAEGTIVVQVDEGDGPMVWTQVQTFQGATNMATVYMVQVDDDNQRVQVVFGDGTHGRKPIDGADITVNYWIVPADVDGNVAQNTITDNLDGNANIDGPWNPKQASGWQEAEGSTQDSLALVRATGPTRAWVKTTVINPNDVVAVIDGYIDPDTGNNPVVRALVVENGVGQNTIDVVVIGDKASYLTDAVKQDIADWFNGNAVKGYPGRVLLGVKVHISDFVLVPVDITATVTVPEGSAVTQSLLEQALNSLLDPVARENGRWRWGNGGMYQTINPSWLVHQIFLMHPDIQAVQVTTPASSITFKDRELPTPGTITVGVVNG